MDLQRISIKLYLAGDPLPDVSELIPVFHRWIQTRLLDDLLMIDVADYSHVHDGPGVMLIAHEAQIALDGSDGRQGLLYCHKRGLTGDLAQRIRRVLLNTLRACRLLERDPVLGGATFATDEMMIRIDDRLVAPSGGAMPAELTAAIEAVTGELFDGQCSLEHQSSPKSAQQIVLTAKGAPDVAALLERAEAAAGQVSSA